MATPSKDLLEDICTRFILTAPASALESFEYLMFLVEQAHWFYEDNVRSPQGLKKYNLRDFAGLIFSTSDQLKAHLGDLEDILQRFKDFKKCVPVMGAILLDTSLEQVLLVRGATTSSCWSFPRGKINTNESEADCAVREVLEETGYDIEDKLVHEDFIEVVTDGKRSKLYIIAGLDPATVQFAPATKGEIGAYGWYRVDSLPCTAQQSQQQYRTEDNARTKFYMVHPYMAPLKRWIKRKRQEAKSGGGRGLRKPSPGAPVNEGGRETRRPGTSTAEKEVGRQEATAGLRKQHIVPAPLPVVNMAVNDPPQDNRTVQRNDLRFNSSDHLADISQSLGAFCFDRRAVMQCIYKHTQRVVP